MPWPASALLHRPLALRVALPNLAARGQRGRAYDYNIKPARDRERQEVEKAEKLYERFVAGWNPRGPKMRTSAARGGATTEAAR